MLDNLYLFEFVINRFNFLPIEPFPEAGNIKTIVKFENKTIELTAEGCENWPPDPNEWLPYYYGKSLLFTGRPTKVKTITSFPLTVEIGDPYRIMGTLSIPWKKCEETFTTTTSREGCKIEGEYELIQRDQLTGLVELQIRLSNYGQNIQSKFYMKPATFTEEEQYYFKNPRMTETVECSKLPESETPVNARILKIRGESTMLDTKPEDDITWANLFKTNLGERFSIANPEFGAFIARVSAYSMVTMGEAPIEKRVKEICEMIEHIVLDLDKEENPDIEQLTVEEINASCCKNRDCEGVKKFQEAGIKFTNLNKVNRFEGEKDYPRNYGMSRTYGDLHLHGPSSKYRPPKRIIDQFVPVEKKERK